MRKLDRWICWLKNLWRINPFGFSINGHDWKDVEEHKNVTVTISQCEVCRKKDIAWSRKSFK